MSTIAKIIQDLKKHRQPNGVEEHIIPSKNKTRFEDMELQNPFAVANFIIKIAMEKDNPVTNLKLQKIMFFLQGYCLSKYETPLIDGTFSKWRYGPIEEDVYRNFKNNGARPITYEYEIANIKDGIIHVRTVKMDRNVLNSDVANDFEKIVENLVAIESWKLVEMTHLHSSWKDYVDKINTHEAKDYTNEEIKECFIANKKMIIGEYNR
ncbi:Panacea domain-containing protein [Ligilactobacillus salivarius]|uniref:Panacea domain-containing protein n=1 Tax=Ligilactobacillus salivarius TaxID=1624 RepID=UPI0015C4D64A|nr:type II toxin-antitoxin system antitoxin SocA domain-containing protein [Ligilactobacillus salivarius]